MTSRAYFDSNTGEELLYFSNFVTAKKLVFCDFDGEVKQTVRFDSIVNTEGVIENVHVERLDSFVLLMQYRNLLLLANEKGEKLNEIRLDYRYEDSIFIEFEKSIFAGIGVDGLKNNYFLASELSIYNDWGLDDRLEHQKKI